MKFSIYPAACLRVGVTQLAVAAIFTFTTINTAEAIQPPVKDTYITLSLPGVVGDFAGVPNAPSNSIQVLALSFGASCPGLPGSACTNPSLSDVSITKLVDDASPALFLATVKSTTYATAVLYFWQAPTSGTAYTKTYTVYLTQAAIDSLQQGGGEGGSPSESVSLRFTSISLFDNVSGAVACYNVSTKASSTSSQTC
jgi:type VI protein secretion system component Hcp